MRQKKKRYKKKMREEVDMENGRFFKVYEHKNQRHPTNKKALIYLHTSKKFSRESATEIGHSKRVKERKRKRAN